MPRVLPLLLLVSGLAVSSGAAAQSPADALAAFGPLGPVPAPADNPTPPAKVALGRTLFEDPRLSDDNTLSCASCHQAEHGWATPLTLGPAHAGQQERRNAPSLVNVAFAAALLRDGRKPSLEVQAVDGPQDPLHQAGNIDLVVEQLRADAGYAGLFAAAFGDAAVTPERIGRAIAAFERTLVFDDSPLDRYMAGDERALGAAEKRGLGLFLGQAGCVACHHGPNLTDDGYHNLGVPDHFVTEDPAAMATIRFDGKRMGLADWQTLADDPGRQLVTHDPADHGKFRTPSLRNVAQTGPYMHNGALMTLAEVVRFYNAGGGPADRRSAPLRPLGLGERDMDDLVAFLRATTGTRRAPPFEQADRQ